MDIDTLIADTTRAMQAQERGKYGRTATIERDGVTCTVSESRGSYGGWKARMQLKQNGKVVSRASFKGDAYKTMNVALRAAFEAQAPQIAAEFSDYIRRAFEYQQTKFPDGIPAHPRYSVNPEIVVLIRQTLAPVCDVVGQGGMHWEKQTLALNDDKLHRAAQKYAAEVAVQWFYKTNQKLGPIENPELLHDHGGDVVVKGTRGGKAIVMRQQRVMKWGRGCGAFHQFPARIYVNDKFTTEVDYTKMWEAA